MAAQMQRFSSFECSKEDERNRRRRGGEEERKKTSYTLHPKPYTLQAQGLESTVEIALEAPDVVLGLQPYFDHLFSLANKCVCEWGFWTDNWWGRDSRV
jgi:hypothetical protein